MRCQLVETTGTPNVIEQGADGSPMDQESGLDTKPTITTRTLRKAEFAVTRSWSSAPVHGTTPPAALRREDAFNVVLYLRDTVLDRLHLGGQEMRLGLRSSGELCIISLQRGAIAYPPKTSFDLLQFHVTRSALDEIADEAGACRVDGLRLQPGVSVRDPVVSQLGLSLLPALEQPLQANKLYVGHVMSACTRIWRRPMAECGCCRRPFPAGLHHGRSAARRKS
jgi:hypothetical protein